MLASLNILDKQQGNLSLADFEIMKTSDEDGLLGIGTFANVQLAKCKKTGQMIALKTVRLQSEFFDSLDRRYQRFLSYRQGKPQARDSHSPSTFTQKYCSVLRFL